MYCACTMNYLINKSLDPQQALEEVVLDRQFKL